MASANYAGALSRALVHEGGFANHPADPGGATMRGVTQRVYDAYRKRLGLPLRGVRLISETELQAIYRTGYAEKVAFDRLPVGIDYVVLDAAINSGPMQAIKWLQRALRMNVVDGVIGEGTLGAVDAHPDHDMLIAAMIEIRLRFLRALKTWKHFGKGWSHRVAEVKAAGQSMATGSVPAPASWREGAGERARIEDAKARPRKAPADATTGAGAATTTAGGALDQAKDALTPLAGDGGWIDKAVAALVITGIVLTIGGLAWRWWQSRRAAELADALDLPKAVAA